MKAFCWMLLLIFIAGCISEDENTTNQDNAKNTSPLDDFLEKYNCLTYPSRKPKTCKSEGGECISGCPPSIRHYDTTTCRCGTTCCVWLH